MLHNIIFIPHCNASFIYVLIKLFITSFSLRLIYINLFRKSIFYTIIIKINYTISIFNIKKLNLKKDMKSQKRYDHLLLFTYVTYILFIIISCRYILISVKKYQNKI